MTIRRINLNCPECGQPTGSMEVDDQYQVGVTVLVRSGFGNEPPEKVVIEDLDEKNGQPLICYTDKNGEGRWAYFDQIIRKVSK